MSAGSTVSRAVGVFSLLAIGAILGVALDRTLHSPSHGMMADHAQQIRESLHEQALGELHQRLELTGDQRETIDRVFRRHQATVDRTWETLRPHIESVVDSVHAEIEAVLTPEQRAAFRAWVASHGPEGMGARHFPEGRDRSP